jgi:hypothetical protein
MYTVYTIIPHSIRFTLLLIFEIPSIICYIFVIAYILTSKTLRSAPNNYVMLIVLFISFIIVTLDIPLEIDYHRRHKTPIDSPIFCMILWFIDISCFNTCQLLIAWASFERHILIFHDYSLNQKWKKICFHYMPPVILIIYMMIFYIYVIFLIPCEHSVSFDNDKCLIPCYLGDPFFGLWESIFHVLATTICIIVFSCALLIRVYRSKRRLQQSMNWRKYRKMLFQLISISSLYLSINFPISIIYILSITSFADRALKALECLSFFGYFIPLLLPFICLTSLPDVWRKIKRKIHRRAKKRAHLIRLRTMAKTDSIRMIELTFDAHNGMITSNL